MRFGNLFTTRRKHLLIGAGIGLCILAAPAGVAANGTTRSGPSHAGAQPSHSTTLTPAQSSTPSQPSNAGQVLNPSTPGKSGGTIDSCGYNPSASPSPNGGTVQFGEVNVMEGALVLMNPSGSGTGTRIAGFGADERGILYPHAGSDLNGRPENPTIFVTDLTVNGANSTLGDWQVSGLKYADSNPDDGVFGYTTSTIGVTGTLKSAIPDSFNWTFAAGNLNAEAVWSASSLGLIAGHDYRFQLMVHDGDQNHTTAGGDVGEGCVKLSIPASPGNLFTDIEGCTPSTASIAGGSVISAPSLTALTGATNDYPTTVTNLTAGNQYTLTATAPAGYEFCPTTTNTQTVTIPSGSTVNVIFHVQPTPPGPSPECTPNKTVSPSGSVPVGTVLTYTVTMTNNGGAAGDCALTDVLSATSDTTINVTKLPVAPAGTTMTILNGACSPTQCSELPLTINWSLPGLAAGASKSFTMQATVTGAGSTNSSISSASLNGTITNTATSTSNCTTNCIIIVTNPVTFALSKSVSPTGTLNGPYPQTVTYTVTLTNTSANPAVVGVLVDDVLSGTAGFTVNDGSFKGPADMSAVTKVGDGHYQWTIPAADLPAGGAASVTFTASVSNASNQDSSTLANCLDSVTSGSLCLDNVATALGMKVHVQNPVPPAPASSVQAITTTPSTGITNEMNIAVAGFLFLGGLGLVLLGLLAKAPAVAPRRTRS